MAWRGRGSRPQKAPPALCEPAETTPSSSANTRHDAPSALASCMYASPLAPAGCTSTSAGASSGLPLLSGHSWILGRCGVAVGPALFSARSSAAATPRTCDLLFLAPVIYLSIYLSIYSFIYSFIYLFMVIIIIYGTIERHRDALHLCSHGLRSYGQQSYGLYILMVYIRGVEIFTGRRIFFYFRLVL